MTSSIQDVHEADIAQVREYLRSAIARARDEWLPSDAIVDALVLELVELAGARQELGRIAEHLKRVATLSDQSSTSLH